MVEAVVVAYGRSPIGRASKGSLVDVRPDDLAAYVTDKVLQKVPQLDRTSIDDLMCGCGLPAGEQGFNIGRAGVQHRASGEHPRPAGGPWHHGQPVLFVIAANLKGGRSRSSSTSSFRDRCLLS